MSGIVIGLIAFTLMMGTQIGVAFFMRNEPVAAKNPEGRLMILFSIGFAGLLVIILIASVIMPERALFDSADQDVRRFAVHIEGLDRSLRRLGPPAAPARELLFRYTITNLRQFWPEVAPKLPNESRSAEALQDELELAIENIVNAQAFSQTRRQAQSEINQIIGARHAMAEHSGELVPYQQFILLISWLMVIFGGIGLIARGNALVTVALTPCAAAMALTLFFIREFDEPFAGTIVVSGEALLTVLHALSGG